MGHQKWVCWSSNGFTPLVFEIGGVGAFLNFHNVS